MTTVDTPNMAAPSIPAVNVHVANVSRSEEQPRPFPERTNSDHSVFRIAQPEDPDKGLEISQNLTVDGLARTDSAGVDVKRAERDFAQLNRQFSDYSERSRRIHRQQSGEYTKGQLRDVEKAVSSDESLEQPWDLETALRGAKAAEHGAGIKVKRIGAFPTMLFCQYIPDSGRRHMG